MSDSLLWTGARAEKLLQEGTSLWPPDSTQWGAPLSLLGSHIERLCGPSRFTQVRKALAGPPSPLALLMSPFDGETETWKEKTLKPGLGSWI